MLFSFLYKVCCCRGLAVKVTNFDEREYWWTGEHTDVVTSSFIGLFVCFIDICTTDSSTAARECIRWAVNASDHFLVIILSMLVSTSVSERINYCLTFEEVIYFIGCALHVGERIYSYYICVATCVSYVARFYIMKYSCILPVLLLRYFSYWILYIVGSSSIKFFLNIHIFWHHYSCGVRLVFWIDRLCCIVHSLLAV